MILWQAMGDMYLLDLSWFVHSILCYTNCQSDSVRVQTHPCNITMIYVVIVINLIQNVCIAHCQIWKRVMPAATAGPTSQIWAAR